LEGKIAELAARGDDWFQVSDDLIMGEMSELDLSKPTQDWLAQNTTRPDSDLWREAPAESHLEIARLMEAGRLVEVWQLLHAWA
jgi:hypothetical protein